MLLAQIGVGQRQSFPHIAMSRARDRDSTRLSKTLQASRDIHPLAKEVRSPDHHITDVNAYPEQEPPILCVSSVRLCQLPLHRQSALDCINSTREFGQHAVTSGVRNPSAMGGDKAVHDLASDGRGAKRPGLV